MSDPLKMTLLRIFQSGGSPKKPGLTEAFGIELLDLPYGGRRSRPADEKQSPASPAPPRPRSPAK
jgi:hypothetical protein